MTKAIFAVQRLHGFVISRLGARWIAGILYQRLANMAGANKLENLMLHSRRAEGAVIDRNF
jgi:hypothetical protein